MPFEIVRNDITNMQVDAIVNTANPRPVIGSGTDSMIHEKAGPLLLLARRAIGSIRVGQAAVTPAFGLRARLVIHTVGPVWDGGSGDAETLLRSCYNRSLALAHRYRCKSVAFPLISSGNYGFPKDKALQIAIAAFSHFLMDHEMKIYLVVFDAASFRLSEKLFQNVASYIDQNYVDIHRQSYRPRESAISVPLEEPSIDAGSSFECCAFPAPPMAASRSISLRDQLSELDAGFSETLLHLIDDSGKKDSEIYKKAGLSKQHFSKIRNNPGYQPTKATAISLALALELDVEQTNDLIGRAGYTLTNSSKFDLIIRYFIERREFNIVTINCALFEYDQSLLGS